MSDDAQQHLILALGKTVIDLASKLASLTVRVEALRAVLQANGVPLDGLQQAEDERLQALLDHVDAGIERVTEHAKLEQLRQMLEEHDGPTH